MNRTILLLAGSALVATPALGQHAGHDMPGMTMPMQSRAAAKKSPAKKKPTTSKPAAKAGAKRPAAKSAPQRRATKKAPAKAAVEPHAGHDLSSMPGMAMPAEPADPHAAHDMGATAAEVPVGPPPSEALQGPENAGDVAWGRAAMDRGRSVLFSEHGGMSAQKLLLDQAEVRLRDGNVGYFLKAQGWYGGDIDKLWLKTEVGGAFGRRADQAEFQGLWSHAVDPWFDLQAGVRLDTRPQTRGRLVVGVQGLAPYWIEVEAAAFLSDKGDVTARLEAEHDVRITQRLILQPRGRLDFSLQNIPRENIGAGLSKAELGLRLRYEFVPNFAPYAGLAYEQAFGSTRRFVRADGHDPGGLNFVIGVRTWF